MKGQTVAKRFNKIYCIEITGGIKRIGFPLVYLINVPFILPDTYFLFGTEG